MKLKKLFLSFFKKSQPHISTEEFGSGKLLIEKPSKPFKKKQGHNKVNPLFDNMDLIPPRIR